MLSVVLARAVKRGLIERNYALSEFVDPLTGTSGEKEIYEGEEVQEFMKCVATEEDIRKKTAFSILIYLGLRLGEVVGLEFKDINHDKKQIAIMRNTAYVRDFGIITKEPKTKASKAVLPIPQDLMDLLMEYKIWWDNQKLIRGDLWQDTDRLFCQDNGKDMAGSTIRHWLNNFEQKHNLKHVTPHGLRHTAITMLIDNDVNPKAVSEMARHSRIQTTLDIYTHRTTRGDRTVADTTNRVLKVV